MDAASASSTQLLAEVSQIVKSVPHQGIGYGLLRYLHAPTAAVLAAAGDADIYLSYLGMIPEWQQGDGPVQFDSDSELTVRQTLPGLGHPLELRAYRHGGVLHVDWWFDSRSVPAETVADLAEHFPATLMTLIDEAIAGGGDSDDSDDEDEAFALIDLSAAVSDDGK